MKPVLVNSNVLLDLFMRDPQWLSWSSEQLARCADESELVIEYCLIDNVKQPSEIPALLELMTTTMKDGYFVEGEIYSKTHFKKRHVDCLQSIIFGRANADMHEYFEKYSRGRQDW